MYKHKEGLTIAFYFNERVYMKYVLYKYWGLLKILPLNKPVPTVRTYRGNRFMTFIKQGTLAEMTYLKLLHEIKMRNYSYSTSKEEKNKLCRPFINKLRRLEKTHPELFI